MTLRSTLPTPAQAAELTSQRFDQLVALSFQYSVDGNAYWRFRCDCGAEHVAAAHAVKRGEIRSCGCLRKIRRIKAQADGSIAAPNRALYLAWSSMKRRCENPKVRAFARFGGRGIAVCDDWRSDYSAFRDWALSNGYADHLAVQRRDPDGDYSAENCYWSVGQQKA